MESIGEFKGVRVQRSLSLQKAEPAEQLGNEAALSTTECELCVVDSPIYEMGRVCCKVRFLMHEPRIDVRRGWIERWKKKSWSMGTLVEEEVRARWLAKK